MPSVGDADMCSQKAAPRRSAAQLLEGRNQVSSHAGKEFAIRAGGQPRGVVENMPGDALHVEMRRS
jgi:hypothetical protein